MFTKTHGQDHIINYVKKAVADRHFPHTVLLSGRAGFGLFNLGMAITSFLMCQNRQEDACGECSNCRKVNDLQHPDVHLFFPTVGAGVTSAQLMASFRELATEESIFDFTQWLEFQGAADKSLNINTKIIEEINHAFSFKSFEDGPRVFLIWGAEFLGKEGNKLLKVIEEPPQDVYIILMAENRQAILTTILSRCQTLLLKPLSSDDILRSLQLQENDANVRLTQLANGDLIRARAMLMRESGTMHDTWLEYLRTAFKGHPVELLDYSGNLANNGKEFCRQFFHYGTSLVSQMLRSSLGIPTENDTSIDKLARLLTFEDLEALSARLQKDYIYVNRNANLKILMVAQSLWISEIFKKTKKSAVRT